MRQRVENTSPFTKTTKTSASVPSRCSILNEQPQPPA